MLKRSYYNLIFEREGKQYIYNTLNNILGELDSAECISALKGTMDINELEKEKIAEFKAAGVIIDEECDEFEIIRERGNRGRYSSEKLSLTIIPSLICNYECIYCYQTANEKIMTTDTQKDLISFVEKAAGQIKELEVTWFGGEPLLQFSIIDSLSNQLIKICDKNNISYSASIITNGFLVTDEVCRRLKDIRVSYVQITIDGVGEIHDERRKHKLSEIKTFEKCIEAVKKCDDEGFDIDIRINSDKTNINEIPNLLTFIKQMNLKNTSVSFERVTAFTEKCADRNSIYFSADEFSDEAVKMYNLIGKMKLYPDNALILPKLKYNYCGAEQIFSYVVDAEGDMYKCWCDIGDKNKTVGNVADKDINDDLNVKERLYVKPVYIENEKCAECKLLPMCMGGCPREALKGKRECCISEKEIIQKAINYLGMVEKNEE